MKTIIVFAFVLGGCSSEFNSANGQTAPQDAGIDVATSTASSNSDSDSGRGSVDASYPDTSRRTVGGGTDGALFLPSLRDGGRGMSRNDGGMQSNPDAMPLRCVVADCPIGSAGSPPCCWTDYICGVWRDTSAGHRCMAHE